MLVQHDPSEEVNEGDVADFDAAFAKRIRPPVDGRRRNRQGLPAHEIGLQVLADRPHLIDGHVAVVADPGQTSIGLGSQVDLPFAPPPAGDKVDTPELPEIRFETGEVEIAHLDLRIQIERQGRDGTPQRRLGSLRLRVVPQPHRNLERHRTAKVAGKVFGMQFDVNGRHAVLLE